MSTQYQPQNTFGSFLDSLANTDTAELEKQAAYELEEKQTAAQILFDEALGRGEDLSDFDWNAVEHDHLVKTANAVLIDQAVSIIQESAEARGEDLSDIDFDQVDPDQIMKVAGAIIEEAHFYAGEEMQQLQLTPRLEACFSANQDAMQKFASLHPDQQAMIVNGDLMGTAAAAAFNAEMEKVAEGTKVGRPGAHMRTSVDATRRGTTGAAVDLAAADTVATGRRPLTTGVSNPAMPTMDGRIADPRRLLGGGSRGARALSHLKRNKGKYGIAAALAAAMGVGLPIALSGGKDKEGSYTEDEDNEARAQAEYFLRTQGLWKEAAYEQDEPVLDLTNAYIHDYLVRTGQVQG